MSKPRCPAPPSRPARQRGAILLTASLWFLALIGLAAVVIDVGHLMVVRAELQNAADASALAGANCLNKTPNNTQTDCSQAPSATLNWDVAAARAFSAIALNRADNSTLGTGLTLADTVRTGYKNLLAGGQSALQPISLSPVGTYDKPAVMVTLRKDNGKNSGPVQTLITRMFAGAAQPMTASAVAVISNPGTVGASSVIPQAINKCLYDLYWDATTNSPRLATSSSLNGVPQVIGQPWELRIGSSYHYPNCDSGQWTTFGQDTNDIGTVRQLIANGNGSPLALGDNTWIEPGTKSSLFDDLSARYPTPLSPPTANTSAALDVTLLVVDQPSNLNTKGTAPIVGFAGFHITDIQGGSGKYVQGHFITASTTGGSGGIGPNFGTYTPPRLAQ